MQVHVRGPALYLFQIMLFSASDPIASSTPLPDQPCCEGFYFFVIPLCFVSYVDLSVCWIIDFINAKRAQVD